MSSRAKAVAVRAAMLAGVGVGLLAVWYASMVATPSGFEGFVADRKAKWPAAPAAPRSPDAKPVAAAAPTPALAQADVARTLKPNPLFDPTGTLGYTLTNRCISSYQVTLLDALDKRSKDPIEWESFPDDAFLLGEVNKLAKPPLGPGKPLEHIALTPDEIEHELDRLEQAIYGQDYALDEFDGIGRDESWSTFGMLVASRWPVLRAVVRGDREKAARLVPRWMDLELNHHRNACGDQFPYTLQQSLIVLLMMADQPGFPQESLQDLQARFEAALLTDAQQQELLERHFLRVHRAVLASIDDSGNRSGNTWHYFLNGGVERAANTAILPGVRKQLELYTMARIHGDEDAAESINTRLATLWVLANLGGTYQSEYDSPYTISLLKNPPMYYQQEELRRVRPNWEVESGVVLIAMLRYRHDEGRLPTRGSDLAPKYVTDDFLRSTQSAWRIVGGSAPALVRFDPTWLQERLPDGSRLATRPGGLEAITPEELALPTTVNSLFQLDILRDGWAENSAWFLPFVAPRSGS